ncbi:MAG: trypsin-like peptidase domain-containing protein [Candidatus Eremiobacteraeota bacterium]|nr:trypsin-like peptidase domain-containing protein [Candidatus Eremiobacteraeota bacterium]
MSAALGRALVAVTAALLAGCAGADRTSRRHGDPFPDVFRHLRPSVVLFTMLIPSDDPKKKGHWDEAYGTGIIVASGGWGSQILTVDHVIADARNLRVTISERRVVPAHVIARNEKADVALVETNAANLSVVPLGSSVHAEPGEAIGVAGYPVPDAFADEGLGTATSVYAGRISSVRKDAFELDLPVIPGESGGPVFDAQSGEVIGLAESRFEEEKAIGFAIPIDDAKRFIAHLRGSRVAEARGNS